MTQPGSVSIGGPWIKAEVVTEGANVPLSMANAAKLLNNPFNYTDLRKQALLIARVTSPDSIRRQFEGGYGFSGTGMKVAWSATKPFGNRPPPKRTLWRSGKLARSWMGGPGNFMQHTGTELSYGSTLPYAHVHQSRTPTIVRPRRRAADGRWAMFWKLALSFGVWLSEEKLERGLVIPSRRVGIGRETMARIGEAVVEKAIKVIAGGS